MPTLMGMSVIRLKNSLKTDPELEFVYDKPEKRLISSDLR